MVEGTITIEMGQEGALNTTRVRYYLMVTGTQVRGDVGWMGMGQYKKSYIKEVAGGLTGPVPLAY